jgi:tRNA pseudouridine55 synthase
MDGLLAVDKPSGPTSHDVVARVRRALGEKRIGHTGTLDPMATGLLLLVLGKATRLAKFLSASDKSYDATVRFGFATDTADAQGRPLGAVIEHAAPPPEAIDAALEEFRGTFLQQPPAYSAKKVGGQRSYKLARSARLQSSPDPAHPAPPAAPATTVIARRIEIVGVHADTLMLSIECSTGFYVRSLAHDLGVRLGVGAHLAALRRTKVGDVDLTGAVTLDSAERDPQRAASSVVPLAGILPRAASVILTPEGVDRAVHGRDIGPADLVPVPSGGTVSHDSEISAGGFADLLSQPMVKVLDGRGSLVAIAQPSAAGLLHPSVVLM